MDEMNENPAEEAQETPEQETAENHAAAEVCVPLDALKTPDEGEKMETPEPGDTVSYTTEGKVTRIEGGNCYVQPQSVNGVDVGEGEEEPGEPSDEDEMANLQQMAAQQPPSY